MKTKNSFNPQISKETEKYIFDMLGEENSKLFLYFLENSIGSIKLLNSFRFTANEDLIELGKISNLMKKLYSKVSKLDGRSIPINELILRYLENGNFCIVPDKNIQMPTLEKLALIKPLSTDNFNFTEILKIISEGLQSSVNVKDSQKGDQEEWMYQIYKCWLNSVGTRPTKWDDSKFIKIVHCLYLEFGIAARDVDNKFRVKIDIRTLKKQMRMAEENLKYLYHGEYKKIVDS